MRTPSSPRSPLSRCRFSPSFHSAFCVFQRPAACRSRSSTILPWLPFRTDLRRQFDLSPRSFIVGLILPCFRRADHGAKALYEAILLFSFCFDDRGASWFCSELRFGAASPYLGAGQG